MQLRTIIQLILSISFVIMISYLFRYDVTKPNYEFIPEMVHSIAYDAYSPNPNYQDKKTLQSPPKGSISLGFMPEFDGSDVNEIMSPLTKDEIDLERGQYIYNNYCVVCHGGTGNGDGPVTKRGVPPPPSIISPKVKAMSDGKIYQIVSKGLGNMPPYNVQINRKDRWQVTHLLKMMNNEKK